MGDLTDSELLEVTNAFVNRLNNAMSNAGCNDVCNDEFSESLCRRFRSDYEILDVWKVRIMQKIAPKE